MAIDSGRCINCKACIVACQQRNKVPGGQSRNWVRELDDESRKSGVSVQPGACMHCDHPVCVYACPTGATYKGADGAVEVDKNRCIGCLECVKACPLKSLQSIGSLRKTFRCQIFIFQQDERGKINDFLSYTIFILSEKKFRFSLLCQYFQCTKFLYGTVRRKGFPHIKNIFFFQWKYARNQES